MKVTYLFLFKSAMKFALKVIILGVVHLMVYFTFLGEYYLVSNRDSYNVIIPTENLRDRFCLLPRNKEYFGFFGDASNGKWLNELSQFDGRLELELVDINVLQIQSLETGKIWGVSVQDYPDCKLEEKTKKSDFSRNDYILYHIWRLILVLVIFLACCFFVNHRKFNFLPVALDLLLASFYIGYIFLVFT